MSAQCVQVGPDCIEEGFLKKPIITWTDNGNATVTSVLTETRSVGIGAVPDPTGFESVVTEYPNTQASGEQLIVPRLQPFTLEARAKLQNGLTLTRWIPEFTTPPPEDPIPPVTEKHPGDPHRVPPEGGSRVPDPEPEPKDPPPDPDPGPGDKPPRKPDCPDDYFADCPVEIRYIWDTNEALSVFEVDEAGLDRVDRAILESIVHKFGGGPVGLSTLAIAVAEEEQTVEDAYEPFLIQMGFLQRTPRGRVATASAIGRTG